MSRFFPIKTSVLVRRSSGAQTDGELVLVRFEGARCATRAVRTNFGNARRVWSVGGAEGRSAAARAIGAGGAVDRGRVNLVVVCDDVNVANIEVVSDAEVTARVVEVTKDIAGHTVGVLAPTNFDNVRVAVPDAGWIDQLRVRLAHVLKL